MNFYEDKEQVAFFKWCRLAEREYPQLKWIYSSQSGVKFKNALAGARAKASGMKAGVPDIFLPYPIVEPCPNQCGAYRIIYAGLYIEMKRRKSKGVSQGKLSPAQKDFLEYANGVRYKAIVCYGADEAIQAIKDYLSEE